MRERESGGGGRGGGGGGGTSFAAISSRSGRAVPGFVAQLGSSLDVCRQRQFDTRCSRAHFLVVFGGWGGGGGGGGGVLLLQFCRGGSIRVLKLLKLKAKGGPCLHRAFLASPAFAIRRANKAAKRLRRHTKPHHATKTTPKQQRPICCQILLNFFFPLRVSRVFGNLPTPHKTNVALDVFAKSTA